MKKNNPFVIAEILMIAILVIIAPVLISSGAYVYVPEEITGLLMLISVLVSLIVIISTPPPFFRRKSGLATLFWTNFQRSDCLNSTGLL